VAVLRIFGYIVILLFLHTPFTSNFEVLATGPGFNMQILSVDGKNDLKNLKPVPKATLRCTTRTH
jgi:hypothetical protein